MIRNLKALGLGIIVAFALSAVTTSAASAEVTFHAEQENVTRTVAASSAQTFSSSVASVTCPHVTVDVTVVPKTTNDISAVPNYATTSSETEECKMVTAAGTFKIHIDMNSCYYTITSLPGTANGDKIEGTVHIKCNTPGDSVTGTGTILGQSVACIHIPEQTPTNPTIDYTNEGTGNERTNIVTSTVEGITYTLTAACNKGTEVEANDAKFTGEATITGENALGEMVGIWIE